MLFQSFLPTDNQIRVTFGLTDNQIRGAFGLTDNLDFGTLPPWIEVLDDRYGRLTDEKENHIFASARAVLPSDLLRKVLSRGNVGLKRITARRKIRTDNSVKYLLGFIFEAKEPADLNVTHDGLPLLKLMLLQAWGQVKIYRRDLDLSSTSLDISLTSWVEKPSGPRFAELNCWGMRELL